MIRILHIVGRMDRAGAESMIMNLYRVLDRERFQFDFLYFTNDKCDFDSEIISLGGKIYRLSAIQCSNPISRMFALKRLLEENKQLQIIHCHTSLSNAFHLWAGKMAGVNMRIAHSHSTSDTRNNSLLGKIYGEFSRFVISKKASHFISCGEDAAHYLFPNTKNVILFPNSVDIQSFANTATSNKEYLRQLLKLPKKTLLLVQIGRLIEVKNHKFSIKLAAFLNQIGIDFHMVFVGDGTLMSNLKDLVSENEVQQNITFMGLRSDISKILAGSDLMLMPSLHEGFPVVLVESQSSGIPALVSDKVSKEVDLGVGLIEFLSLDDELNNWMNKILEIKEKKKISTMHRIKILSEKGFDMYSNISKLEKLYTK
jgi:glycosyltransferase EpsF